MTLKTTSGPFVFLSVHFNTFWGSAFGFPTYAKTPAEFFDTPSLFVGGVLFSIVWLLMLAKVIYLTVPGILCLILYWNKIRKYPRVFKKLMHAIGTVIA